MPKLLNLLRGKLDLESTANMSGTLEMSAPVELIEAAAAKEGEAKAPPTFDAMSYTGAPMQIKGWKHPVIIDLQGVEAAGDQVPVLRAHDDNRVVGHSSSVEVSEHGVRVKGVVSGVGPDAQEVVANAKNGFKWQISNGSSPVPGTVEHLPAGKTAVVNGRTIKGPHSIARKTIISEVSFLPRGADSKTSAAIAAQHSGDSAMTFEQWLEAKKIDASAVTDATRPVFEAQWKAEIAAEKESGEDKGGEDKNLNAGATKAELEATVATAVEKAVKAAVETTTKEIKAAAERENELADICAGHSEILAKAKKENWSTDKAKLAVIEATMEHPYIASTGATDGAPDQKQVIEAALCVTAGMDDKELKAAKFDDKTIDAATSGQYRGFGMHALMYRLIRAAGHFIAPGMINEAFIRAAFEADREINASGSAVSMYSLSGAMSNIGNKFVTAGFNSVETAWQQLCSFGSLKDFKPSTIFRLGGDFEYKKLPPGGEIEHATMVEGQYTNRLDTFARMFGMDRRDLINDDMNVFQQTFRLKLGRGAGLAINREFWTTLLTLSSSFFTFAKGNKLVGDLDIDGLTAVEQAFLGLTDENGDPINSMLGAILVTSLANKVVGEDLFKQSVLENPSSTVAYFPKNPHTGKFKPVSSFYMTDPRIVGDDPDPERYFILGDPNALGVGVIQVAFWNGKRKPTIETAELDFNTLGIQARGVFDFGVSLQEEMCGIEVVPET